MCGRLDGIEEMQQRQRGDDTGHPDSSTAAPLAFRVQRGVKAESQTEQGAHVPQQAGERRGVQMDPGWIDAPPLGFLKRPQQIHTQSFEEQVQAHRKREQEQRDVEVIL